MEGKECSSEALEALLAETVRTENIPGLSVAVARNGRVRWMKAFGFADIAAQKRATPETVYMWFSMTKIVTATAIMQLRDDGRLELDSPVSNYISNFPTAENGRTPTIRHLLNHSSGLPNPIPIKWVHPASEAGPEPDEFLNGLLGNHVGRKLRSQPGKKTSYSNIGFVVLGAVITAASGETYKEYVVERILRPLEMFQTSFAHTPDMLEKAATGYQKRRTMMALLLPFLGLPKGILDGNVGNYRAFDRFYLDGASYGGLLGPVGDAVRFVQAHLNRGAVDGKKILSADSTLEMQQISLRGDKLDVGLGWYRRRSERTNNNRTYLEHLGAGAGFFNEMRIYPEESLGIVVMGNLTRYDIDEIVATVAGVNWN